MKAHELCSYIDSFAPFSTAEDWDNVGLLVGSPERESDRVLVALDVTSGVLEEAVRLGAGIILSHHPVIFLPLRRIDGGGLYAALIRADVTVVSAHTNLDFASGGVNDALAGRLGLGSTRPFDLLENGLSLGRIGELEVPMEPAAFAQYTAERLGCGAASFICGDRPVKTVAVSGGKLSTPPEKAAALGCDALVSSEIRHSDFLEAAELGLTLVDAGHFFTEAPVAALLTERLSARFPGVSFIPSETAFPIKYTTGRA